MLGISASSILDFEVTERSRINAHYQESSDVTVQCQHSTTRV